MFKVNSMLLTLGNCANYHALLTDGKICASKICDGNEGFECLLLLLNALGHPLFFSFGVDCVS